jgi:hypothetical protein
MAFSASKNPYSTEPNVKFGPGSSEVAIADRARNRDRTGVADSRCRAGIDDGASLLGFRCFGGGVPSLVSVGASAPMASSLLLRQGGVGCVAAVVRRSDVRSALRRRGFLSSLLGFVG